MLTKKSTTWQTINETSLSRAYRHARDGHFGIISTFRACDSPVKNLTSFNKLKARLAKVKLGGIVLVGHWVECQDPSVPYAACPVDKLQDVTELALFVPGIDLNTILSLSNEFDQDCVVYCGPETGNKVVLAFRDGELKPLGSFQPNKIARAYSELRGKPGRTFVFEYVAQSFMDTLAAGVGAVARLTEAVMRGGDPKPGLYSVYKSGGITLTRLAAGVGDGGLLHAPHGLTFTPAELVEAYNDNAIHRTTLLRLLRRTAATAAESYVTNPRNIRDLAEWTNGERTKLVEYCWLDEDDVGYVLGVGVTNGLLLDLSRTYSERVKSGTPLTSLPAFAQRLLSTKHEPPSAEDGLVDAFLNTVGGPGTDNVDSDGRYMYDCRYNMPWDLDGSKAPARLQQPVSAAAEAEILENPLAASWYARYVLKRRWPQAEPMFLKLLRQSGPDDALGGVECYIMKFFPDGWKEADEAAALNPHENFRRLHARVKTHGHADW